MSNINNLNEGELNAIKTSIECHIHQAKTDVLNYEEKLKEILEALKVFATDSAETVQVVAETVVETVVEKVEEVAEVVKEEVKKAAPKKAAAKKADSATKESDK